MHSILKLVLIFIFITNTNISFANSDNIILNITGQNSELNNKLKQNIDLSTLDYHDQPNDQIKQQVINNTKEVLAIYGYYDAIIKAEVNTVNNKTNINLAINPGQPVVINNIKIIIADPVIVIPDNINQQISKFKQEQNKIFNQLTYEKLKENLIQTARNTGYLNAEYTVHKVTVDQKNLQANINLTLNLKKIFTIHQVKIKINNKISTDDFAASFLPYQTENIIDIKNIKNITMPDSTGYSTQTIIFKNTPYISSEVLNLQNSLNKYYRNISIVPIVNQTNKNVDLYITVTPLKNYLYNIGLGYGTDEGARVFGGLQIRNITDYKHKLDIQGKTAQFRELAEINYLIPGYYPATDLATFGYQYKLDKKRTDSNIQKQRQQLIGQYQRQIDEDNLQSLYTGGLSYRAERYTDIVNKHYHDSKLLVPYLIYDQTVKTNSGLNQILNGRHINIMLEAANRDIISSTSFVRLSTKFKSIIPLEFLGFLDLRLISKARFGQIWHQETIDVPPTLRFFAGGTESIRGYRFEALGPTALNTKGKAINIGGDRLVTAGIELEKNIYKNWSAAIFYDDGNALNTWHKWQHNLYAGTGFGIRWQSPLGPVKFDIAKPLDDTSYNHPNNSRPWRFDINIGPDL